MFTLLRNFRAMFMGCIITNFEVPGVGDVDANNDGKLSNSDLRALTPEGYQTLAQLANNKGWLSQLQTVAADGTDRSSISLESIRGLLDARDNITQVASNAQDSTSRAIENFNGVLSPNKLRSAVNFYKGGRCTQENMDNLAQIMLQRGLNYDNTWESFAENIAIIQSSLSITVDGKAGNGTITALNTSTVAAREATPERRMTIDPWSRKSIDTQNNEPLDATNLRGQVENATMHINYPPQGRAETIALQQLITTPADGAFGLASRRALQVFLQSKGLYTGAIDGDIGRGSRAAIAAYNGGAVSTSTGIAGGIESATTNESRSRGREAMNSRDLRDVNPYVEALDKTLDSSVLADPRMRSLVQNISRMSESRTFDVNVWNSFISTMNSIGNGWPEFGSKVQAANFTEAQKFDFLTRGFEENTMGGAGMTEQLQTNNSIASISAFEQSNRDLNKMAQILSSETGISIQNIVNSRQAWLNQAGNNSFSAENFTQGEVWSTRSQGITDITGIRAFRSHQIISLPGSKSYINMGLRAPELIGKMSDYALEDIRDNLGSIKNRVTVQEIRQALLTGNSIVEGRTTITLTYDVGFFKSADCFNDAIGIIPKVETSTQQVRDNDNSEDKNTPNIPGNDARITDTDANFGGDVEVDGIAEDSDSNNINTDDAEKETISEGSF